MSPTDPIKAEMNRCRAIFDRLQRHLDLLDAPEPLTCAQVAEAIARLNVQLAKHLKKSPWGPKHDPQPTNVH